MADQEDDKRSPVKKALDACAVPACWIISHIVGFVFTIYILYVFFFLPGAAVINNNHRI